MKQNEKKLFHLVFCMFCVKLGLICEKIAIELLKELDGS